MVISKKILSLGFSSVSLPSCSKMSPATLKKPILTAAEKSTRFRLKNPNQVKMHRLKNSLKNTVKRLNDPHHDEDMKKKAREKKRKQRADAREGKQKTANVALNDADNPSSEADTSSTPMDTSSRPMDSSSTPPMSSVRNRLVVKFPFSRTKTTAKTRANDLEDDQNMFEEESLSSTNCLSSSSTTSAAFGDSTSFSTPPFTCSTPVSIRTPFHDKTNLANISRQSQMGKRIRKKNNQDKSTEIAELKAALAKTEEENVAKDILIADLTTDLKKVKTENDDLRNKLKNSDNWLKPTYKNMTISARTELKTAVQMAKIDFSPGTISRLRNNTGINFSNPVTIPSEEESTLKKTVVSFAVDNSCEVPDMRASKKGLRHFYSYKYVLWMQFKSSGSDISYSQICRYWPANIIKPKIEDFGTCRCQTCENVELLASGLKRTGFLSRDHDIEIMIKDSRDGNDTFEEGFKEELAALKIGDSKDKPVSYLQWEKVNKSGKNGNKREVVQRVQKTESCQEAAKLMETMYENLKKHLERNFTIKKTIRERREMVMESADKAYIHMDWAENLEVHIPGEIQSAYFSHLSVSIHTGYLYSKDDCGGFASLSDENNHKAEAIHAALKPVVENLVDKGIKHLICVSDSPTSQYRNNKNVHLTKELAVKHGISIEWIFTEAGHGKSCCDGVGGTIKTLIRDLTAFNTSIVITKASDVLELIQNQTTIDLTIHTKEDIQVILDNLPYLSSLKGANKFHQITFDSLGNVQARALPTDPTFSVVKLNVLRSKPTNRITEEVPV